MLATLQNTYQDKKILLTGHTGFKGSWILTILNEFRTQITGYALAPEKKQSLYNLIEGDKLCRSIIADIRDKEKLIKTVLDFQPDFIFHFAAQSLVRRAYQSPVETYETNVNGTLNLLEAVRNLDKRCNVIIVTTDKV